MGDAPEPYEYGDEKALIEAFRREYSWKYGDTVPAGCENGELDPRWNGNGLFDEIGRHPRCIRTPGRGRPSPKTPAKKRGSDTIYIDGALDRLRYIVTATEAGLGAEKIKTALKFDVPEHALEVCGNDKSIRCILTRPLVLLLNIEALATLDATSIYRKVWRPYDLPKAKARSSARRPTTSESAAFLLAGANPNNHPDVRDDISLAIYLSQPGTPEEYVADLRRKGSKEVVDAMRRIVGTTITNAKNPRDALAPDDAKLVEKHARKGYEISIRRCPPVGRERPDVREHPVYACHVSEGNFKLGKRLKPTSHPPRGPWREGVVHSPMTLLEHSCSHLSFVLAKRDAWVRRCNRERFVTHEKSERCPVFFAVYDQERETCGTSRCKRDFDPPRQATDDD